MEIGAKSVNDIGALFICDVRLGQHHGDTSLISIELCVMPFLEGDSVIESLMFNGGLGTCVNAGIEVLGFEDSNPRMGMQN